jgi:hypothetical protein
MLSVNGLAEKGEVYMPREITGAVLCGRVRIGRAVRGKEAAERGRGTRRSWPEGLARPYDRRISPHRPEAPVR